MNDSPTTTQKRRLILIGSTGSIGVSTLQVVQNLDPTYEVVALAAGSNADLMITQARQFNVTHLALANEQAAEKVQQALPHATVLSGDNAAEQLVEQLDADMLVSAVVGAAGLPATIKAIEKGMTIGLANKETLVAAGELILPLVYQHKTALLPIDSEHSAIFQCLQCHTGITDGSQVKRLVLTASGGPFRTASKQTIDNASVEEALNHPTWDMGQKISIDSATMINKALEIIEAHWLFGLSADQIDVIIHPQSIIHSFVEFVDHSVLAQLGTPDMKTPIQYALTYPQRTAGCSEPMDWTKLTQLSFEQPDHDRFPALKLAYRAIREGGTTGAIFNAANEAAVAAFLGERIPFGQIVQLATDAMDAIKPMPAKDLQTILEADHQARAFVAEQLKKTG